MRVNRPFLGAVVLCAFSLTYPLVAQGPQDRRDNPQARPGGQQGGNTGRPNPGAGRPTPGGGNNGRPQVQPARPNPGNQRPVARPNPGNQRPPARPNRPPATRPPQWGHRPPNRPSYSFRPNDRSYLYRYYGNRLGRINRARRPHFIIGGYFPYTYIPYISPLPPDVYGYLPPPPPGYRMGYYQGYVVVYDPVTYFIANIIDLLQ